LFVVVIQQLLEVATPIMSKIQEESIFPAVDYSGKLYFVSTLVSIHSFVHKFINLEIVKLMAANY
jgi:hypothetical protein